MTIEKGRSWGALGRLPDDGVVVRSDGEASAALEEARRDNRPFPVLGLLGGDLCRTLGGPGDADRLTSDAATTFTIDLGQVLIDGRMHLFVAHLVARTRTWSRALVAMNAQWHGVWNLGPKAHPNDGLLDVYEAQLAPADRLRVRSRLAHGAHLPHPGIAQRRVAAFDTELPKALPIRLDGRRVGTGTRLAMRIQPDAVTVVI